MTPEQAFALVSNEIRQEILLTLSKPGEDTLNTPVLSFSELYSRADVDVGTSNFNYHLQQLLGKFIEKRGDQTAHLNQELASDEGYALRPEGLLLTWIIRSATSTKSSEIDGCDAGFNCYHCGHRVEAKYENAIFLVECPGCDYHYDYNPTPPGIIYNTNDCSEILNRVGEYNRTIRSGFARGVCPLCANTVDYRFVDAATTNYPRKDLREVFIHRTCDHCRYIDYLTVGEYLLQNASLIKFCLNHDIDVTTGATWDFEFAATDKYVTVEDKDPWLIKFTPQINDDTLVIQLDATLTARGGMQST